MSSTQTINERSTQAVGAGTVDLKLSLDVEGSREPAQG